jgi:hypothetical protein
VRGPDSPRRRQRNSRGPGGGGAEVNDRDVLEFDLFVESQLRQQQEQLLLSRLQRPAAAPSEGERHGGEVLERSTTYPSLLKLCNWLFLKSGFDAWTRMNSFAGLTCLVEITTKVGHDMPQFSTRV